MGNDGAVLFCDRKETTSTFDAVVTDLGYVRTASGSALEVVVRANARGTCLRVGVSKALALAIGRRLARALRRNVRVFTASVTGESDDFDCAVDDLTLTSDGNAREGRWAADLVAEFGSDWGALCDGKAYFAVSAILDNAMLEVLEEETDSASFYLAEPPSLGAKRLDEIARNARLAERAQLTSVAGRDCVRILQAGATVTSFISSAEAEVLRKALGAVLG